MINELIKIFLKVAEQGSISKAATELYISQPALSQKLKDLEEELECELFVRSNRGTELTGQGKIVQKYFLISEGVIDEMKEEIENNKNKALKMRIAAIPTSYNYSLPCAIYHLKQKYPDVFIEVYRKSSSSTIRQEVISEKCDIGFVSENIDDSADLNIKKIYEERIVLVSGTERGNFPDFMTFRQLEEYDLIKMASDEDTMKTVSRYISNFENLGFNYTLESIDAIKCCLLNGYGLAFLPYSAIKREVLQKKAKIINIENLEIVQNISLITRTKNPEGLEKILEYTGRNISKIIC